MDHIRSYLLSIIVAALICSILSALPGKNGTLNAIRKTLCGVFMSVTLISPLTALRIPDLDQYLDTFRWEASDAVQTGELMSRQTAAQIIKQQTATYILDKAKELGASLEVTVTLSDGQPQTPCAVTISGMVSPYLRQRLTDLIEEDLQIKKEDQHWISIN